MPLLLGICLLFSFNTLQGKAQFVPDEIVVIYDSAVTASQKADISNQFGLTLKGESLKPGRFVVYQHSNPDAVLGSLKQVPGVLSVERNAVAQAYFVPNDEYYYLQWNMPRIGMEYAWDYSSGEGTIVAVLDTGVLQSLPDFAITHFMEGYDFVNNDNDPSDDHGHGSHVTGTVAQSTNNYIGEAGVAFNTTIMPVKVLDQTGSGTYTWIANGIYYAVDHGAQVINMSLGGTANMQILEDAVNYAWESGLVIVCASGNNGNNIPVYPAAYENSISVGATTPNDQRAPFSSYGDTLDMCAPGVNIRQNGISMSGTSCACPHVSGVAALIWAIDSTFTNVQVRYIIESTAEDLGEPGWDPYFGHGLVDAAAAVDEAMSPHVYMFINNIAMRTEVHGTQVYAFAYVQIKNTLDEFVQGATVTAYWSDPILGICYLPTDELTDVNGIAVFKSPPKSLITPNDRPIVFVITVMDVTHPQFIYDPDLNKVPDTAKITYPN